MGNGRQPHSVVTWARSWLSSLGMSLFLWLFGVILVAFATYATISIRTTSQQWRESVHEGAQRFSELIKRSTHYEMLLNRKEDVLETIENVAGEPGVEGVRIYDKQGVIIFSAKADEVGQEVDMAAEACIICHDSSQPLHSVPSASRVRVFGNGEGRTLGLISPIENAPECAQAPCHAHPADQTVLGVLDVKMSLASADARLATARRQVIVAGVLTSLLVGVAAAMFIFRMVRKPVRELIEGTERVAYGDLEARIAVSRRDEMGQLARAFNRMTEDLLQARRELTNWSGRLEERLLAKTEELNRTQRQVIIMEKMASLGKLSATVAHELNNPLAGIRNYAKLVERTLREGDHSCKEEDELLRYASVVEKEAARCGDIVRNLLLFARHASSRMSPELIGPIIDRALMIVKHHLEMSDIKLEKDLSEIDEKFVCDSDQIQQALVALLVNAVESMPPGGTLSIRTRLVGDSLELRVSDTGCGIPADILPHIFEPFYSTKHQAEGVGLGLAVTYGIIQNHGGRIDVDSEVGYGTTFTIILPRGDAAAAPTVSEGESGQADQA